ncbi:hypothetical protein BC834DRAFT_974612 [Gloeopeniophorella convolvens]|nr:hypothetical protein BC834DRAFT_974612 [Gloeopeniophorella convolvens]
MDAILKPVVNTLKAGYFAVVVSSMVYGINLWQAHSYYTKYSSNDGFLLKSFVAFLFILDTASLALSSNTMYVLFVQNFGDPLSDVLNGPWSYAAHGTVAFVVDVCIQNFFAHRVYKLGRGAVHIPIAISLTSLGSFALGLTFNIMKLETRVLGQSVSQNHYIIGVFSLQVACDVFITSGLVYYLFKYRSTVRRTNRALNTLAFYSINCGAINVMTAIGAVTCIISSPQALYWTAFFVLQVKLYFSSFMAMCVNSSLPPHLLLI